jgi:hypothetical protein
MGSHVFCLRQSRARSVAVDPKWRLPVSIAQGIHLAERVITDDLRTADAASRRQRGTCGESGACKPYKAHSENLAARMNRHADICP